MLSGFYFFFFQAEDGIRDGRVTGVQTCALPIWLEQHRLALRHAVGHGHARRRLEGHFRGVDAVIAAVGEIDVDVDHRERSEERRVGKECRSRWSSYHLKKKMREEVIGVGKTESM